MILECGQCRTRYLVPDNAIGAEGRIVRCANCKHSWFQPPAGIEPIPASEAAAPVAAVEEPSAENSSPDVAAPPGVAPTSDAPATPIVDKPPHRDVFAQQPPFRRRRNPARRYTMAAVAAGSAMLLAVGAIAWTGPLASQFGLKLGASATPLQFVVYPIERRDLDNGSELFAVSGKVVNPTASRQRVPNIRAELRDAQDRPVYSWTISPEAAALAPHATVEFNSAKLDVPVNGKNLALSFSSDGAR